ncbi:hypothetical protein [uncultured Tenacibaculum sp.]|uniref:hypothetical protein n=1 Tax=uncultured Tenacibaculum sp. TaxID=174713 RepID=UPI00260F8C2E|nr:hypothetical protein [uncultured Tenacibaculum sp.]
MRITYIFLVILIVFSCKDKGCNNEYRMNEKGYDLEKIKIAKDYLLRHIEILKDSAEAHTTFVHSDRFYSYNINGIKRLLPHKEKKNFYVLDSIKDDLEPFTALSIKPKDSTFVFKIFNTNCNEYYFCHQIVYSKKRLQFQESKSTDHIQNLELKEIEKDWYYEIYSYINNKWEL